MNKEEQLKIAGFNGNQGLKESLVKDLTQLHLTFVKNTGSATSTELIKEVREDEVVLNNDITEENLEKLLKFIKETEKYKDQLQITNKMVDVRVRKTSAMTGERTDSA